MRDLVLCTFLARATGTPTAATVPVVDSPLTTYAPWPTVEDFTPKRTVKRVDRRGPTPDMGFQIRKRVHLSSDMEYAFSLQEFSPSTLAMLLGGNEPDGSGNFVPNARTLDVATWWIIQGYDQADRVLTLNVWGSASIESYKFGERVDPYALVLTQLYSAVAAGQVENMD